MISSSVMPLALCFILSFFDDFILIHSELFYSHVSSDIQRNFLPGRGD